jgi:hypothetical protein
MVEASADALAPKGIIVGNPQVEKGRRVNMVYGEKKPNLLVYAIRNNLIFRDVENPLASIVYASHQSRITGFAE